MSERKPLIHPGERYGRWTVLDDCIITPRGERKWHCRCDCGTERHVLERSLRGGGSKSCGCLTREGAAKAVSRDLTGLHFGELTVLRRAETQRKNGGVRWLCQCSCGNEYEVAATLLMTGRRTHCPSRAHKRDYASADISGLRFSRLVALRPTDRRDRAGNVIWHCRCDCGNEVDVSYNWLMHTNLRSCGCQKKENDQKLQQNLTRVDGTSLDMLKSGKTYKNNTTGCRGVYFVRGKYMAKIVFQKKAYHLGFYDTVGEAMDARREAEELLFDGTAAYYEKWQARARLDPEWAKENPMRIHVVKDPVHGLMVSYSPALKQGGEY